MRKALLIVNFASLMTFFGFTIFHKTKELERQKEGYQQRFEMLNYYASVQERKIQEINHHVKKDYSPVLAEKDMESNFGIGGFESTPLFGLSSDFDFVNDTYKRLKIDQAYARVTDNQLNKIALRAKKVRDSIMHTPTIRPLPVDSIYAISSFGLRMHPILHKIKMHDGIDYAAYVGTPVYATATGTVVATRYDKISGLYIKIEHGYHYTTVYAHLSKSYVRPGQEVKKGQLIGLVGNTGRSVGPHLHYEVRINEIPVNPVRFIAHKIDAEKQCLASSKKAKSIIVAR